MTLTDAVTHFKTQAALAKALCIRPSAVSLWRKSGLIPEGRQYQLQLLTKGKLKADKQSKEKSSGSKVAA